MGNLAKNWRIPPDIGCLLLIPCVALLVGGAMQLVSGFRYGNAVLVIAVIVIAVITFCASFVVKRSWCSKVTQQTPKSPGADTE